MSERLWKTADVAEYLGLAEKTVKRMRSRGEGPDAIRINHRCVRYDPDVVKLYAQSKSVATERNEA